MLQDRIFRLEEPLTKEDALSLSKKYKKNKTVFKAACYIMLFIALVIPFLPGKYKPHDAMIDIMSYPAAVISILAVFAIVILWNYYYLLYRLKKDIDEGKKITMTSYITQRKSSKHKGTVYYYVVIAGTPGSLAGHAIDENQFKVYREGASVIIQYAKHSKQLISLKLA